MQLLSASDRAAHRLREAVARVELVGAITVFIVWNSIPGLDGSSKLRIAECAPTGRVDVDPSGVATFFGSEIDAGELNVPSLPTQLRL